MVLAVFLYVWRVITGSWGMHSPDHLQQRRKWHLEAFLINWSACWCIQDAPKITSRDVKRLQAKYINMHIYSIKYNWPHITYQSWCSSYSLRSRSDEHYFAVQPSITRNFRTFWSGGFIRRHLISDSNEVYSDTVHTLHELTRPKVISLDFESFWCAYFWFHHR